MMHQYQQVQEGYIEMLVLGSHCVGLIAQIQQHTNNKVKVYINGVRDTADTYGNICTK